MLKFAFQKCDVITFTWLSGHRIAKNKELALTVCMHVICMYLDHIYSGFWVTMKILDFRSNYIRKKMKIEFWGQNRK